MAFAFTWLSRMHCPPEKIRPWAVNGVAVSTGRGILRCGAITTTVEHGQTGISRRIASPAEEVPVLV
jgi:hypothetical protein